MVGMTIPPELDDQTLATLVTISELAAQGHSIRTIVSTYETALKQVREFRTNEDEPYTRHGF